MTIKSCLLITFAFMASFAAQAQEVNTNMKFHIAEEGSWLRVLAYPDGPLRRFGHNHVISHHNISGSVGVASNPLESIIMLSLKVADFDIDNPAIRELEGQEFEKEVSQKDIDGTRVNMLGENLLYGEKFPKIEIHSKVINGNLPDVDILATVIIKGAEHQVKIPARIELTDGLFMARGQFEVTHGDLGLTPFSAAGGALTVRDLLVFKYEISGEASEENKQ